MGAGGTHHQKLLGDTHESAVVPRSVDDQSCRRRDRVIIHSTPACMTAAAAAAAAAPAAAAVPAAAAAGLMLEGRRAIHILLLWGLQH